MKRYLYQLAALLVIGAAAGCSEKEEFTTSTLRYNDFLRPEGETEEISALQEEFYRQEGVYVLFNDTLSRQYLGDDPQGNPCYSYHRIDMTYSLTGSSRDAFEYTYLETDAEKQNAARFISEQLLPRLSEENRPYSVLLVNAITQYTDNYGTMMAQSPAVYSGWQCTAIAVEGVDAMDEQEMTLYQRSLLKAIVNNKMATVDESVFAEFYSFCLPYYGTFGYSYDDPDLEGTNSEMADYLQANYPTLKDLGLLSAYGYMDNASFKAFFNFKAKEYDLSDYIDAIFSSTKEEFLAENADYPIVIEKYNILRGIIADLGVILD